MGVTPIVGVAPLPLVVVALGAHHQVLVTLGEAFTVRLVQAHVGVGAHRLDGDAHDLRPLLLGDLAQFGPHRLPVQHLEEVAQGGDLLADRLVGLELCGGKFQQF